TRACGGVDEIAMQAHGRADADRRSLDRRQQRLVEARQRADELAAGTRARAFGLGAALGQEIADIVASAERAAGPGHQHCANAFVGARRRQRLAQGAVHGAGECVLLLRAVQRGDEDAAVAFDIDAHAISWSAAAAPASAASPETMASASPGAAGASFSAKNRARPMRPASACGASAALARQAP